MTGRRRSSAPLRLLAGMGLVALCAAPTPGDVGGCGQKIQELDAPRFFGSKKVIDCRRCNECGIDSAACDDACDDRVEHDVDFPEGCLPLVHDGEVCLRKLFESSCDDYSEYTSDAEPRVPTECNFCPQVEP